MTIRRNSKTYNKIGLNTKRFAEILNIPKWTKHTPMQDSPLDGEPARELELFDKKDRKQITSCEHHLVRKKFIVKCIGGMWFEADDSQLDDIRRLS